MAVGLGGLDQAGDDGAGLAAAFAPSKQPVLASDRHCAVILPMSGRRLRSFIAGIRCTVVVCGGNTASAGLTWTSSMLK